MAETQTLASRIRTKYPGAYDDMSDEELSNKVLAKHPQYSDLATPEERAKASLEQQSSGAAKAAIARGEQPPEETAGERFIKQAGGRLGDVAMGLGGLAARVGVGSLREGIAPTLGKVGVDIAKGIAGSHLREAEKAISAESMSDSERAGHALAAVTPLVGPQAAKIGEDIASGNYGGAAVEGAMLAGGAAAPKLLSTAARLSPEIQAAVARGVASSKTAPAIARAAPAASLLERAGTTPLELTIDLATSPVRTVGHLAKVLLKSYAKRPPAVTVPVPSIPAGASSGGGYSFAEVPNLTNVATPNVAPATMRAALEAIPKAGGGELAAMLTESPQLAAQVAPRVAAVEAAGGAAPAVPAWLQKIADRAKTNPLPVAVEAAAPAVTEAAEVAAPAAASVAPAVVASEAPAATAALSPTTVFDLAFKQAVAAGKSVPEAATIARAARMQAATGAGGQLAQTLRPVAPAAPTGLNAAYTPELAAIAEKPQGFSPSRPPPPATPGWTPPLRDPAFLEQSALLAKLLEENAPSVVKVLKRRRAS